MNELQTDQRQLICRIHRSTILNLQVSAQIGVDRERGTQSDVFSMEHVCVWLGVTIES